jgi:hypothetical protein
MEKELVSRRMGTGENRGCYSICTRGHNKLLSASTGGMELGQQCDLSRRSGTLLCSRRISQTEIRRMNVCTGFHVRHVKRPISGETGRSFGTRMKEHRKEVQRHKGRRYTRSAKQTAETEQNKSAITDHATHENHVINLSEAKVMGRESDRRHVIYEKHFKFGN